jgi:predicted kinase
MRWVVEGNASGFAGQGASILDQPKCKELTRRALGELERVGRLLDERRRRGFVRQCHGDLHLRNIVLIDGQPTLFDAVEFNDEIACIDVLYDLAFLLMDLWRRRLEFHANRVLNVYLARTGDDDGLPLLPLFLSCRAAVRAKTSATAARLQPDASKSRDLEGLATEYLALASTFLDPSPVQLIAIGGFSGSGKSTLARALAPSVGRPPGAVIVRSDEIRKTLRGVPSLQRLGPDGYTPEVTQAVYRTMADRVSAVLRTGQSVIADAVFSNTSDRLAIEAAAADASVPFFGFWLEAPPDVLVTRVSAREADASDADAIVVRRQLEQDAGHIAWQRVDAGVQSEQVLSCVRESLPNG